MVANSISLPRAGLSVADMDKLRVDARKMGIKMGVYRNTLARLA